MHDGGHLPRLSVCHDGGLSSSSACIQCPSPSPASTPPRQAEKAKLEAEAAKAAEEAGSSLPDGQSVKQWIALPYPMHPCAACPVPMLQLRGTTWALRGRQQTVKRGESHEVPSAAPSRSHESESHKLH